MSHRKRQFVVAQLNMTPMIDVTFQLIIFFLLVNNIASEESVEMMVPSLHEPRTRELTEGDRVTVNVMPMPYDPRQRGDNPLAFTGEAVGVKVGMNAYGMNDMARVRADLADSRARNPKIEVVLRADGALYYRDVQRVMGAISAAEISTVNVVAMMPRDEVQP